MTHEERLAIAAELARRIVDASGDAVLAVFITSSTAKGLDWEHSDLEISAVVRDGVEIEGKSSTGWSSSSGTDGCGAWTRPLRRATLRTPRERCSTPPRR